MAKRRDTDKQVDLPGLLVMASSELHAQLELITARRMELKEGGFDKDLTVTTAQVLRAIAVANAEVRQQEKQAERTLNNLPRELVIAWIRRLPPEEVGQIMRELEAAQRGQSVLS